MTNIDYQSTLAVAFKALSRECSRLFSLFGADDGDSPLVIPVTTSTRFYQVKKVPFKKRSDLSGTDALLYGKSSDAGLDAKRWFVSGEYQSLGVPGIEGSMRAVPGNTEQYEVTLTINSPENLSAVENSVFDLFRQNAEAQKKVVVFNPKPFHDLEGSGKVFCFNPSYGGAKLFTADEEADVLCRLFSRAAVDTMAKYSSLIKFSALSVDNTRRLNSDSTEPVYTIDENGFSYYGCGADVNTDLFLVIFFTAFADCLSDLSARLEHSSDIYAEANAILSSAPGAVKDNIRSVDATALRRNIPLFNKYVVLPPDKVKELSDDIVGRYVTQSKQETELMLDLCWRTLLPEINDYSGVLANNAVAKKALLEDIDCGYESAICSKIAAFTRLATNNANVLEQYVSQANDMIAEGKINECAEFFANEVSVSADDLLYVFDELEGYLPPKRWPAL